MFLRIAPILWPVNPVLDQTSLLRGALNPGERLLAAVGPRPEKIRTAALAEVGTGVYRSRQAGGNVLALEGRGSRSPLTWKFLHKGKVDPWGVRLKAPAPNAVAAAALVSQVFRVTARA